MNRLAFLTWTGALLLVLVPGIWTLRRYHERRPTRRGALLL